MAPKSKSFIFTISPGHTGTLYLAGLLQINLPDANIHHEILGFDKFGVDTPDLSHSTLFNSQGNVLKVRSFWNQKFSRIVNTACSYYGETSHLLAKAGLMENISSLYPHGTIHIFCLKREMYKILLSFKNRFEFINRGNMWLWYLDPLYPRKIVTYEPFKEIGVDGMRLWYICEMLTRAEYYKLLYRNSPYIKFHDIDIKDMSDRGHVSRLLSALAVDTEPDKVIIPERKNVTPTDFIAPQETSEEEIELIKQFIAIMRFDPVQLAKHFFNRGNRL